jgi:hypothetical protein
MNGYHCFNFAENLSYEMWTLSSQKLSNFHSDLSLKLSQGEVHDFSGEVQKFSGDVQNDLSGGAHLKIHASKFSRGWNYLVAIPICVSLLSIREKNTIRESKTY